MIDLTLSQFGCPTTDAFHGSADDYVIQHVENAADDVLVSLAHHVGFEISNSSPGVSLPYWEGNNLRLFLSHLAANREYAGRLQEAMSVFGISCFVAHKDIKPTEEWQNTIEAALSTSEALVALLHEGFSTSPWTDQEIGFAMGASIPVYSVQLGQDPYGFIGRFQAFNGNQKEIGALATELFDVIRKNKRT